MPHAVAAGIASTALTAPVVSTALGTGLAAGIAAGGGGGGLFGSLGLNAIGAPGLSGLASAVTPTIAPAAASQLAGTIGAGAIPGLQGGMGALAPGVTPGLTGSAAQNLGLNALKSQVIGTGVQNAAAQQATNLAFQNAAAQNMANAAGSQFAQVAPNLAGREQLLQAFSQPNLGQNLTQLGPKLAGDATTSSLTPQVTPSSYDLSAGFRQGIDPRFAGQQSLQTATSPMVDPTSIVGNPISPNQNFMQNLGSLMQNPSIQGVKDYAAEHPYATSAAVGLGTMGLTKLMQPKRIDEPESKAMIRPYTYDRTQNPEAYAVSPTMDSSERNYFNSQYVAGEPYKAAEGGIAAAYAVGGPVENMSNMNAIGANTGYPMASLQTPMYSNPAMQIPEATNVIAPSADAGVGAYSGEPRFAEGGEAKTEGGYSYSYDPQTMQFTQLSVPTIATPSRGVIGGAMGMGGIGYAAPAPQPVKNSGSKLSGGIATPAMGPMQSQQATPINVPAYQSPEQQLGLEGFYDMMNQRLAGYGGYGGFAAGGGVGGEPNLGGYSDGGRLLKGPGDGVSDSIPASIGDRQPARLADGEFVVPARIVSELGNGSTEAGARKLYAMMDRVQKSRKKSVGKGKVAVDSKASKHLPA
jgi:hypothetical protein